MHLLEEITKFLAPIISVYLVAVLIYSFISLSRAKIFAEEATFKIFDTVHGFLKNLVVTSMLLVGFFYLVFNNNLGSIFPKNYELKISLKDESSKILPDSILTKVKLFAKFDDTAYPLIDAKDGDATIFTTKQKINRNINTVLLIAEVDNPKYKYSERFIYFDNDSSVIKGDIVLESSPNFIPEGTNAEINSYLTQGVTPSLDSTKWYEGLWKLKNRTYWVFSLADSLKIVPLDSIKTYLTIDVENGNKKNELEITNNKVFFKGNLLNR